MKDDGSFIEYVKETRSQFAYECKIDSWWYSLPATRRVSIEDLLIAYDQMVEKLEKSETDGGGNNYSYDR